MSTGGQALGGVVGAIGGFFIAGPKGALYGAQIGMAIGGYLDPPKGPVQQGPRLSDLTVQTSTYGAEVPRGYGTFPVVGNIFWLENNKLKETITRTSSGGGKGGGAKTTTETASYSATFAVGLLDCRKEGQIDGVRRVWLGNRLWYDSGSDDLGTIIASNTASAFFTLHKGSTTQAADPRMQAALGVANTPAYRGLAYIVFNDLELAPYSNSLAGVQVKVEVVRVGSTELFPMIAEYISPSYSLDAQAYGSFSMYLSLEQVRFILPNKVEHYPTASHYNVLDCRLGAFTLSPNYLTPSPDTHVGDPYLPRMYTDNPDTFWNTTSSYLGGIVFSGTSSNVTETGDLIFGAADDRVAVLYQGASLITKTGLTSTNRGGTTDGEYCYTWESDLSSGTDFTKYDRNLNVLATLHITTSAASDACLSASNGVLYFFRAPGGANCGVFSLDLNLTAATYLGALQNTYATYSTSGARIKVIDGYIIRAYAESAPTYRFRVQYYTFSKFTENSVTLGDIVKSECLQSELLSAGDLDVTGLTQSVRGYRVSTVSSIRSAIEPLQAAWPFDVIQHGYGIKFKLRGSSSVATIPATDLDARSVGTESGVSITNSWEMDLVLPRRVTLSYLDPNREYDTGQQYAERLNTDSVNIRSIDLALVLTDAEAAQTAEVLLYHYWLERYDITFTLPPPYNALEPGDTITVNATEATYTLRLTEITYTQDGRLECTAKYNSSATYVSTAVGESGQSTGVTLSVPGDSALVLLDLPALDDTMDQGGYLSAMTGYLSGWTGGMLYRSDDGGLNYSSVQQAAPPGATFGEATNSISAPISVMVDKISSLSVVLHQGSLSSITELALLNGGNHFAYGAHGRWEIIAAQDCVLQGDGSYKLSNMLRGRFGTEWASGLHATGDTVVLLDTYLSFITTSTDNIGLSRLFRAVTIGKTLDSASDQSFTYAGNNLECLSPVYLNGNRHPTTNDWTLTWIRRTRVGGAWRDYVNASLGEASELYDVEIYSSSAYTTLKRTFSSLASATTPYTSAQQVTDFGSNQSTLYVKVYQISAVVGRGYALTTSITR